MMPSAILVEVIQVKSVRGKGLAPDDPIRVITQYWSKEGELLAERDPHLEEHTMHIPVTP